jgi:chromatin structure-remodeling complex subunit RSC1/2
MSSQTPDPSAPLAEIKEEENTGADGDATTTTPVANQPTSKYVSGTTLTKKDFEVMTGILHRLTNYRDKEYVVLRSPNARQFCDCTH